MLGDIIRGGPLEDMGGGGLVVGTAGTVRSTGGPRSGINGATRSGGARFGIDGVAW